MLEKMARQLRSTDRSPPAMTVSANGMTMTGTNRLMHWSMMFRFRSCVSVIRGKVKCAVPHEDCKRGAHLPSLDREPVCG